MTGFDETNRCEFRTYSNDRQCPKRWTMVFCFHTGRMMNVCVRHHTYLDTAEYNHEIYAEAR